jgi:hypothetical protein
MVATAEEVKAERERVDGLRQRIREARAAKAGGSIGDEVNDLKLAQLKREGDNLEAELAALTGSAAEAPQPPVEAPVEEAPASEAPVEGAPGEEAPQSPVEGATDIPAEQAEGRRRR